MSDPFSQTPSTPPGVPSIAIVGGGISGLAAAYELARHGAEFTLFEQSERLGGIVETACIGDFIIECGPDSWVTEKPWARELAVELGLADQLIFSNDQYRRTYLVKESIASSQLVPMPDGLRMMVPEKWGPLLASPFFSWRARLAYLREPRRAPELKACAPTRDESVADFVRRHFGDEVTQTIAAPLLSGVFGGDIQTLSVRAVMPTFVKMEAEHGSLITALRRRERKSKPPQPIFSSLTTGLQTLIEGMIQRLPSASLHTRQPVAGLRFDSTNIDRPAWRLSTPDGEHYFTRVVLATPAHITRKLLTGLEGNGPHMAGLLPQEATSAIIVALAFDASQAANMRIPQGFGFLVPPMVPFKNMPMPAEHRLLACTFVNQKFSHRAPSGSVLLRAFFGGVSAEALLNESDTVLTQLALRELSRVLGTMPEPSESLVRRWPLSLPQYAVGHLERIAELESLVSRWRGLHLIGNAYHGVGLPDLIREGGATARAILEDRK